jgi:translation initiation factor 2D
VSEIDEYLNSALHQALAQLGTNATPLSASSLYSGHVLPCRPASIPAQQREDVVINKSSWKKLAKWIKVVEKEGLVKAKEGRGGEITITAIHTEHPFIALHKEHKTIAKEDEQLRRTTAVSGKDQPGVTQSETPATKGNGKNSEMSIEEVWKPNGVSLPFWEACGIE